MRFLAEKASAACRQWNRKALNEDDFHRICRRLRVSVTEMPLRTNGFYYSVRGRHFIAIDSRLPPLKRLFVMFHELGHFLLHLPDSGTTANFHGVGHRDRKEREADIFAVCALIPRDWIVGRTADELVSDEGLPPDLVAERAELFRVRGI
ncbi:MAG TPA: ImmA/IrrE family metallo-endopeptidase [Pyrinomonadaceae bacterium]|nr:ImmA/IrrE family metallo-endopeptidase [Chloracidobacterium sp.]MBP9936850.1 ImmA/IrrE family metallo-endopeptidase [Pyrinomonadaceae bacterium]MBK9768819.1 ImmA/IrrE family metallo-endopeptidase [Chloracidobacterium sp.]MBL0242096.1 ImmA/IrrE family metallo-endopeptidase [Chloracidobacterium sp.]HQX55443.1 ImmA/IrrE family metallo-endopeptidase [Pyrinomonadaceae bacterium]